jgi:acyl-CoA synthetase (AMP-forming)/AMP-acid ligase II
MTVHEGALSERIAAITKIDPGALALEFDGRWYTWDQLDATITSIAEQVPERGTQIGIILRNHPAHVGALLGVLRAGGCAVAINPHRGLARTQEDIAGLGLGVVIGSEEDLRELVGAPGVPVTVGLRELGEAPIVRVDRQLVADPPLLRGVAVRMLTSGTTGAPKRIALGFDLLERVLQGAKYYERDKAAKLRLRRGVAIVNAPLVHVGGVFRTLQCVNDGRAFCLLERFSVDGWSDAVRRHRPQTASLVPAALRMVLEADLDPGALSSLRSVVCGTAPLDPADADAFFERYGIPVLVSYGATEFGGGVAGWNLPDHEEFWAKKRGSVGRAHPGCALRVVDEKDGRELGADEPGLLEVKADQLGGREWIRTTDIARIDSDGFLWILGRADQAILRGGFKVLPDVVQRALERHPDVRGATVMGRRDTRLGAVPVAAVELRPGAAATATALLAHAAVLLAPYEIPVEIEVLKELPRTDSGKVDLVAVSAILCPPTAADLAGRR